MRLVSTLACLALAGLPLIPVAAVEPPAHTISYADMVARVSPAVVTIRTTKEAKARQMIPEQFRRFFEQRMPKPQQGQGSGVIVQADGVILTNNHVIDEADKLEVLIPGTKDWVPAKVVGTDPKTDLAVVRIEGKSGLPVLPFAPGTVRVGDLAFAIGNPFGVGQTVTMGIVSAIGRGNVGIVDYEDFIQTDASINPGNSGGALVDSQGRLIGINTAILAPSGVNNGIGFAVPVTLAKQVLDQILGGGKVVRGWLGVRIDDVDAALARKFGVDPGKGALVSEVVDDSPAQKAGLQDGDVILAFDGAEVPDVHGLRMRVAGTKPGTQVPLVVMREGKRHEMQLHVGELAGDQQGVERPDAAPGERIGIQVRDLDPELRRQIDLPKGITGVLITGVEPDSRAAKAGLQPGMVVIEVERKPIATADQLRQAIAAHTGEVLLRIWHEGGKRYFVIE